MKTTITYKQIWAIAYPIILGSIAQNIINVTDTAFLGRVGQVELGAGAVAGLFYYAAAMLGWGYGIGAQIIIARRYGESNYDRIGGVIGQSIYFLLPLAILMFSVVQLFGGTIFDSIMSSDNISGASTEYIQTRIYGVFFAFFNFLFRAFYLGVARTKIITYTTVLMAAVNVTLDYWFIFGGLGLEPMGIRGAALASVIAEGSAFVCFLLVTYFRVPHDKYQLFKLKGFNKNVFTNNIRIATPMMLQNFISIGGWFLFFLMVEHLGEMPLAVSNVVRSVYVVLLIPIMGYSSATNTLVSQVMGKGKINEVLAVMYKTVLMCIVSVAGFVIVGFIFPDIILRIYTNDPIIIRESVSALYVVCGSATFLGTAFVIFSAVSGTGKTNVSFGIEIVVIVIYLLYVFLLTNYAKPSISVVWTSEYIYAISLGGISLIFLLKGKWKNAVV